MANQTMLLNPTRNRPCPLLLPPPSRIASSSWVGFTPRTDLFHCLSITHHRHQPLQTSTTQQKQPFSKNKQTKLYWSLTSATPDNEEDQEYYSTKEEEESQTENKEEVEKSRKWSSVKKVYFLLAAEFLLYRVSYAIMVMNPAIRSSFEQKYSTAFCLLYILTYLCLMYIYCYTKFRSANLLPRPFFSTGKEVEKYIYFGLFVLSGAVLDGSKVAQQQLNGRILLAASILTLAMVYALTKLSFWASQNGKLGLSEFLSLAGSFIFIYVFHKQKWKLGIWRTLSGIVGVYDLIDTTGSLIKLSKDEYIKTCLDLHFDIYYIFYFILHIMLVVATR